jgi:hypothetical protein
MSAVAVPVNFVTAHLMGGLGNQLFQIFATMAYALENKMAFRFPYSEVLTTGKHRPTYWDTIFKSIRAFAGELPPVPRLPERGFSYTKIPSTAGQSVSLYGYYQSPQYFEAQLPMILRLLRIEEQRATVRAEFAELLGISGETASIHFRLGDYKANPAFHPIMPVEYYKKALARLPKDKPYRVLYFCEAEDNAVVNTAITELGAAYPTMSFVKVPDEICDWKQMFLMSLCNHNIIANSSFSWWGAYFGMSSATNRTVCYPGRWFGPSGPQDVEDLFPSSWCRVPF